MHHPDTMLTCDCHDFFKEVEFDTLRGGITRKVEHQHLGLWPGILDRLFQFFKEIDTGF